MHTKLSLICHPDVISEVHLAAHVSQGGRSYLLGAI
jgi:hypothetical protein